MRRFLIYILLAVLGAWATVTMQTCGQPVLTEEDFSRVVDTNAPPVDLAAEVAKARAGNKLLLLEFGSSDSCPPCVAMQKYVFSSPEFKAYASSNLNFVRLDYPQKVDLRPDTKTTNAILARQFSVDFFPTFVALDRDGKEFWHTPVEDTNGVVTGGITVGLLQPKNFIALVEDVRKKEK